MTRNAKRTQCCEGFTIIELVIVLIMIGLLAVFIAPRLQTSQFDELGFFHETLAAIRYAHKVAITSGCEVQVSVAANTVSLDYAGVPAVCGTGAVLNPFTNSAFVSNAPPNVSIAGADFVYDMIGDPSVAQNIIITNSDASTHTITITDETGFAFSP